MYVFMENYPFIDIKYPLFGALSVPLYEPCHEKTCLMPYANNKDVDQPAHLRSLINAFVVHCLDSIIYILPSMFIIS